jgi:hypothetical protein
LRGDILSLGVIPRNLRCGSIARASTALLEGDASSMTIQLRDYVYLDEALVERFLSQLDDGVVSEEEKTQVEKSGKTKGGGLKVPIARADIDYDSSKESSTSLTVRQTADSACSRLIDALDAADSLQFLEALDDGIWTQLRRGEALQVNAEIELSALSQLGGLADAFGPMAEIMQSAGAGGDFEGLEQIKAFSQLAGQMKKIPVLARPSGAPDYTFIANLKPDALLVEQSQLTGEAVIVGTLERRLRDNESWSIFDALGFAGLPREMRRELEQNFSTSDESEIAGLGRMIVKPPAALLNPIAIYH